MDALFVRPLRMAGSGHSRGNHPEAVPLRGDRRHRRRPHNLDSGGARYCAQLGLSVLLATRRLLRRPRAQSPRRHEDHGRLSGIHYDDRRVRAPGRSEARLWNSAGAAARRNRNLDARRLRGHGARPGRQSGAPANSERQLWQRHSGGGTDVLRSPLAQARRRRPAGPSGALGSQGGTTHRARGCRHMGVSRPPGRAYHSAALCWAACDRLSKIAQSLNDSRAVRWRGEADRIRQMILTRAWNDEVGAFAASFGGKTVDASVLLLQEFGLVAASDPRFKATLDVVTRELRHGDHLFRYRVADDFGTPTTAFNTCTFWYIDALTAS